VRYERTGPSDEPRPCRARLSWGRPRQVLAVLALVIGVGVAVVVATGGSRPVVDRSGEARAVAQAFLEANALEQNLGAPEPEGVRSATWALRSDPFERRADGTLRLKLAEASWISKGHLLLLRPGVAARIAQQQERDVSLVFTGPARDEEMADLGALLHGEDHPPGTPVGPGGARVAHWDELQLVRSRARVQALVSQWEQLDTVVGPPGARRVAASLVTDEVSALAILVRAGGRWRVTSLTLSPWQQPT